MREFAAVVLGGCVTALHGSAPMSQLAQPFALPAAEPGSAACVGTMVALGREPTVLVFYRGHW